MKILYDHQIFAGQVYGGISRYFTELIGGLHLDKNLKVKLSLIYSENFYIKDLDFCKCLSFLSGKNFKGKDRLLRFFHNLNRLNSVLSLKRKKFDIFHPTEYDPYFLDYIEDKPFVLTVYDMIHEIFYDKYFLGSEPFIKNKKKLIEKASKIIAISHNTKKDIIKLYSVNPDKIEVVHLANSLDLTKITKIKTPERFILFIGGRGRYKNFALFFKAVLPILQKDKTLYLICVGNEFTVTEKLLFKENDISEKIKHYILDDSALTYLYSKALAFVFSSLYEGFGIPILEAFNCGCPVALSKASCFPEIAQDGALYFDPNNSESIKDIVEALIYDDNVRSKQIKLGLARAKNFSWRNTVIKTSEVYKSIL